MILFGIFFVVILIWIGGFLYANDFTVPTKNTLLSPTIKNVLIIFPHADDEAMTSGGLISQLSTRGKNAYWIVLTKGEKGTLKGVLDKNLAEKRVKEAKNAASVYGVKHLIQRDYPDGAVADKRKELEKDLKGEVEEIKPDAIITYDLTGLYGHPDHVVTSEVITELVKQNPTIKLWYMSYPKRILDTVSLPTHMANDKAFAKRRVYPTHKVWVGWRGVINKIKAVYRYKSQKESYISSFPIQFIPLWFYVSLTPFEYYHEMQ